MAIGELHRRGIDVVMIKGAPGPLPTPSASWRLGV
jgi:hypothetical protein